MDLKVVTGADRDRVFKLYEGQMLVVGRSATSDTQLQDPHVSRKHCILQCVEDLVTVTDCGSSGGSFINGQRIIGSESFKPGDVLRIGRTEIRYELSTSDTDESTVTFLPKWMRPDQHQNRTIVFGSELSDLPGQIIDKYLIDKEMATGRTGAVFLAKHTESGKRYVVKALWPAIFPDEIAMSRFVLAMKAMRTLKHPNIVRVLDVGKTDSYCWLAMEYVTGIDGAKLIKRIESDGMLEWQTVFRVAVHVSRALEAAVAGQIVHRYIVPQDIFVQSSDKTAKLGGLMPAEALDGVMRNDLIAMGEPVGELPYMSPEATFETTDLDSRSDIYSLGATVYSLLTGRPPFASNSTAEMIDKIRVQEPEKPDRHGLPTNERFEAIVMKMLAKKPADRYQNPTQLLKELNLISEAQGIEL